MRAALTSRSPHPMNVQQRGWMGLFAQLQDDLLALQDVTEAAKSSLKSQTSQQQAQGISDDGVAAQLAPWSHTRPPAQYVASSTLDDNTLQELLDSQLVALAEAEQSMSQLVAATKEEVAAAQKLCHARRELLINARNRWLNQQGTSPLLRLPIELLRAIARMDVHRELRAVCTALRNACGSPGRLLGLYSTETAGASPSLLAAELRRWPWPEGITVFFTDMSLPLVVFSAVCDTFHNLQQLSIPSGDHPYGALRTTLTSLEIMLPPTEATAGVNADAPFDPRSITHLTALQSLDVHWDLVLPRDLVGISSLLSLTRLELVQRDTTSDPELYPRCCLSWQRLSALSKLPNLASLTLWLDMDWAAGADGSGEVALAALTHLDLGCAESMLGFEHEVVPVVDMFRSMPLLASLELHWAELLLGIHIPGVDLERLLQALQACKLQHLHLEVLDALQLYTMYTRPLMSSLTSLHFTTLTEGTSPSDIPRFLTIPTALVSFHFEADMLPDGIRAVITLLAANAPHLTDLSITDLSNTGPALVPAPDTPCLPMLSNLQTLLLSGRPLVKALGPSLVALPLLTRLQLPDSELPLDPSVLAALTQLTNLRLGARHCHIKTAGRAHYASYLPAIRLMSSLAELRLDVPRLSITEPELREMVPPPASLTKLVVNWATEDSARRVLRVLGRYVRDIRWYRVTQGKG